jgi:hypothetical protein
MQGFYSTAQNTRVSGDVFNRNAWDSEVFNELSRAAGRIQDDIFLVQRLNDFVEAVFVKYRN